MTLENVITFDLLSYYDSKLKNWIRSLLGHYYTSEEVDNKINTSLTSAVVYKGSVQTIDDLPTEGNKVGDMYNVIDSEYNYIFNGEGWDIAAPIITIESATRPQIESLFED